MSGLFVYNALNAVFTSEEAGMIDFNSKLGRKTKRHLKQEYFIWLTTVNAHNAPQPRPVWFIVEDDTLLVYSQPDAFKVKHIGLNPEVALHFNTMDPKGEKDVIVLGGRAEVDPKTPPAHKVPAYLRKYRQGIRDLGATPEQFAGEYSTPIRIQLTSLRGW
jgi:PPOX class probable F420-dependent enzyme